MKNKDFILKTFIIEVNDYISKSDKIKDNYIDNKKKEFCKEYKCSPFKNTDIVYRYINMIKNNEIEKNPKLELLINKRAVRSASGVNVITCMTKQFPCPGRCIYCPSEPNMPKSYLSNQPAAMRAVLNKFDPFLQVQNRLSSLMITGHEPSKIEIIVIGGTWSALPKDYQDFFISNIYNGLNQSVDISNIKNYKSIFKISKTKQLESLSLEDAIKKNEGADYRCVGLTLETRPDWINIDEIKRFRYYGCTRVELGVQSLDDEVQKFTKRGHNKDDLIKTSKILKDAGFKISYHIMPGLPGSNLKKDLDTITEVFNNEHFLPDLIKIYPCVITKFSELEKTYKEIGFKALKEKDLMSVIITMKKFVQVYCRISKLVKDIPSQSIKDECKTIN